MSKIINSDRVDGLENEAGSEQGDVAKSKTEEVKAALNLDQPGRFKDELYV